MTPVSNNQINKDAVKKYAVAAPTNPFANMAQRYADAQANKTPKVNDVTAQPVATGQPAAPKPITYGGLTLSQDQIDAMTNRIKQGMGTAEPDDATKLQNAQIDQAKSFRAGIPEMQQRLAQNLAMDQSRNTYGLLNQNKESMSRRGLLYGGLNSGREGQIRAQGQANLAASTSQMNQDIYSMADQLDAEALQSAHAIRQNTQQIQDAIYSQAMARMNANNSMIGNIASTAAMVAFLPAGV